ncbi:MAG: hypothetical protein ACRERD_08230 [Candidatus Binatia bacterium]
MQWRGWFPWRLWLWWNAHLDARKNIPSPEATALSETEREIQSSANTSIRKAEQRFAKRADPVESKLAELRKALQEISEPEYLRLQEKTGRRDVLIGLSFPLYLTLLGALTIGEMIFNIAAFNVFQEPALYTLLMALAVGVAVPICAHVVGMWLRQWPPPWWKTAIYLVSLVAIIVPVLAAMNRARLAYLQELAPEFVTAHPELNTAFLAINLLIVMAAALLSYLAHDPEPGFAEAKAKLDWSNAAVRRLEGKLDQWANAFRTEVEMLKQAGWGLMAYYRKVNRRRRDTVPGYFDNDSDKNHLPAFVAVREIGQYHTSGVPASVQIVTGAEEKA